MTDHRQAVSSPIEAVAGKTEVARLLASLGQKDAKNEQA